MAGDIGAGLSGYWAFNEAAGTTAADSSTLGGNSGTLTNGPTHVTGQFEGGLHFDGVDDYVTLGSAASLPTSGEISISAWIKPESISGVHNIVAHGYDTNPNGEVFFRVNGGQYQVGSWNGDNYYATATIPSEDVGNWVHLAGTYDGTTWRLYRNGTEVAASAASTGAVAVNASWAIGARGTGGERLFQGSIDEVRIYDRGLIADEVATLAAQMGQAPVAADLLYVASAALADDDVIGTVSVTDPDAGDTHTFAFASGNDAGGLAIDANGQITVADAEALDFGSGNVLAFTVEITDGMGLATTARVSIAKPAAFTVSGSSSATQNTLYMLTLDSSGIAGVTWTVNWGDGVTESTTGNTAGMGHLYQSPGNVTPTVTASLNGVTVTGLTPATVAITQQPGVNLVRNGSFEVDVVTHSANWQTFASIADWNIEKGPRVEVQKNVFGPGDDGPQYLELDGDLRETQDDPIILPNLASSRISQPVSVVIGATYTLSFAYRARLDSPSAEENILGVTVTGANLTIAPLPTENTAWQTYTYTFVTTSSSVKLTFEDLSLSNGHGTLLDNVKLTLSNGEVSLGEDDYFVVRHGETLSSPYSVLANDGGSELNATLVSSPSHGSLSLQSSGFFQYSPASNFVGDDSFTYALSNGFQSSQVTAYIRVKNIGPAPIDDQFVLDDGSPAAVTFSIADLLFNDIDFDGDQLVFEGINSPQSGVLIDNLDGTFTYFPSAQSSYLEYSVSDGTESATARVDFVAWAEPTPFVDFSIDLKMAAFIPKSKGQALTWDASPGQPYESVCWAPEPVKWNPGPTHWYFATDDRETAGQQGTARLQSDGSLMASDVGSFAALANDIFTTTAGASHRVRVIEAGGALNGYRGTLEDATAEFDASEIRRDGTGARSNVSVVVLEASAAYPFSAFAPNINYDIGFAFVSRADGKIDLIVKGWHDAFPAYEILVNGGTVYEKYPDDPGPTPFNLGGWRTVTVNGKVTLSPPTTL